MKVKLLTGIASPDWSYAKGELVELDKDLAVKWITGGIAETAEEETPAEKKSKKAKK